MCLQEKSTANEYTLGFWNDFNFDADNLLGTENQPQSGGTIGKRVKLSNGSEQNTRRQDHGERSETTARTTQIPVQDSTGVIDFDFSLSSSLDGVEYNNSSASQDNGIEFNINKTVLGNDHDFCQNTATTGDNSSTDHIDPSPHPASPLSGRTQPAEETPSTPISTTCETIQRFATLQQQLCSQRASLLTITRSSSISNKINARSPPLPSQTQNIDIESIFSSCQEILDLTTSTFSYFSTKWKSSSSSSSSSLSYQTHHTTSSSSSSMNSPTEGTCMENDASSVLLVLGPLSLVVITYQDVLNICNAILQDMKEDFHSNTDRERSLSITPLQTPRPSHNTNSTSWRDLSTKLFATNATTLVSKIELETPLRLILLLNVMEFQLMRFERSLETFHSSQNNYNYSMKGGGSLRGIFVSSMSELRSVIKNLLGKVGETVREAKMGTGS